MRGKRRKVTTLPRGRGVAIEVTTLADLLEELHQIAGCVDDPTKVALMMHVCTDEGDTRVPVGDVALEEDTPPPCKTCDREHAPRMQITLRGVK